MAEQKGKGGRVTVMPNAASVSWVRACLAMTVALMVMVSTMTQRIGRPLRSGVSLISCINP